MSNPKSAKTTKSVGKSAAKLVPKMTPKKVARVEPKIESKIKPKKEATKKSISPTSETIPKNVILCASIQNKLEPQNQCLFFAKPGEKFCPLHLLETHPILYHGDIHEIPTIREVVVDPVNPILITTPIVPPKDTKLDAIEDDEEEDCAPKFKGKTAKKAPRMKSYKKPSKEDFIREQQQDTVKQNYDDIEAEM
jgi:hypothetical protein